MREIFYYNTYKKDLKLVKKQSSSKGWDLDKIDEVVLILQTSDTLPPNLQDHNLLGIYKDFRECHIYGDLVIVYTRNETELHLRRIGRHQDLFKDY
ncbi:type II toxin-antitoxin system RelE/ParE family toxin [Helicobacter sp. T3_23-1059]